MSVSTRRHQMVPSTGDVLAGKYVHSRKDLKSGAQRGFQVALQE